jgi:hypothetical protein
VFVTDRIPVLIALVTVFVAEEAEGKVGVSGIIGAVAPFHIANEEDVKIKKIRSIIIT